MINFFHTLCVCILALFGWYQPMESNAQQPIDALDKSAYVYTDRLILSVYDLCDYYRFQGFLNWLENKKGSDYISGPWTYTFTNQKYGDINLGSDLYFTDSYSFSNMSNTYNNYTKLANLRGITISHVISAPVNNSMGYHYYSIYMYDLTTNDTVMILAFMKYINTPPTVSGTLLDNPTSFWTIDYSSFYRNNNYLDNSWARSLVIGYTNEMYQAFRSKGLPTDDNEEWESGYESGYGFGYTDGYDEGLDIGTNQGYQSGYSDGNTQGYQTGYASGLLDGQSYDQTALTIFTGIIEVGLLPVNIFLQMFNYEIFGINISGVVSALLTISIVIIIVRFLLGKKDD